MPLTLLLGAPANGRVGAVAAADRAGQDCLLLAGSMVLAHRHFLVRLDRGAPGHALTAAVNALTASALIIATGTATWCRSSWLAAVREPVRVALNERFVHDRI